MRKPRDFDSEMKTLNERTKQLEKRKLHQLGELVIACGADALPIDVLAGAMLAVVDSKDAAMVEGWRKQGAAFFQSATRSASRRNRGDACGSPAGDGRRETGCWRHERVVTNGLGS